MNETEPRKNSPVATFFIIVLGICFTYYNWQMIQGFRGSPWVNYASPQQYSVDFPTAPVDQSEGGSDVRASRGKDGVDYGVAVSDYGKSSSKDGAKEGKSDQDPLAEIEKVLLQRNGPNAKLESRTEVTMDGVRALDFVVLNEVKGQTECIHLRAFMNPERSKFMQLVVKGPKGAGDANKFFNSFHFASGAQKK